MKTITIKRDDETTIIIQEIVNETTKEVYVDFRKWAVRDENGKKMLRPTSKGLIFTTAEFQQLRKELGVI